MNTKTLSIKARLANHIRKTLYKKKNLTDKEKLEIFDEIALQTVHMHWELNDYKAKRRYKRELLKERLAAPQTKTMKKKLHGKKTSKMDYMKMQQMAYNMVMANISPEDLDKIKKQIT